MTDNTIMESLHNYLPKDLVNIVEEYSKYTNYDKVIKQFHQLLTEIMWAINDELNPQIYRKLVKYNKQRIDIRTYTSLNRFVIRNDRISKILVGPYQYIVEFLIRKDVKPIYLKNYD